VLAEVEMMGDRETGLESSTPVSLVLLPRIFALFVLFVNLPPDVSLVPIAKRSKWSVPFPLVIDSVVLVLTSDSVEVLETALVHPEQQVPASDL
jgi:hypothetical protein